MMGVPKGLLQAANAGKSGKLQAMPIGRRIGPAGPGTGGTPGRRRLGGGAHMAKRDTTSAFGIDHGAEVSKADDKYRGHGAPTTGRRLTAQFFPGWHGGFAGKKGKKLGAAGTELGGHIGGNIAGTAIGAATRRPALAQIGSLGGTVAGAQTAVSHNQKTGKYKRQRKGAF